MAALRVVRRRYSALRREEPPRRLRVSCSVGIMVGD